MYVDLCGKNIFQQPHPTSSNTLAKPSPPGNEAIADGQLRQAHDLKVPGRIGRGSRPGKRLQFASWNMGHRDSGFSHEKIAMFHCFLYGYQRVRVCELENHHLQ